MDTNGYTVNGDCGKAASIGARIREERLRIGLSQTAFAKLLGVHRKTQSNYEQGERKPDTEYLESAARAGVDVGYVLSGQADSDKKLAYAYALSVILEALELVAHEADMATALTVVSEDLRTCWNPAENVAPKGGDAVLTILRKSPVLMLDARQLEDVIEKLEFVLDATGERLTSSGKAQAILSLFREAKKPGARVDFKSVEAVVKACR